MSVFLLCEHHRKKTRERRLQVARSIAFFWSFSGVGLCLSLKKKTHKRRLKVAREDPWTQRVAEIAGPKAHEYEFIEIIRRIFDQTCPEMLFLYAVSSRAFKMNLKTQGSNGKRLESGCAGIAPQRWGAPH